MTNEENESLNWNTDNQKNYVELAERQVFQKIEEELNLIQQNLFEKSEKNMTIRQAKNELKKINERLQNSRNVERVNKEKFSNAIDNISGKNIDKIWLKTAIEDIIKDAQEIINSSEIEQENLIQSIIQTNYKIPKFNPNAQEWRLQAKEHFEKNVKDMQKDKNRLAAKIGWLIEKLIS